MRPGHRGGRAADEFHLNVVDCNASVTVARRWVELGDGPWAEPAFKGDDGKGVRAGTQSASDATVALCRCWIWFTTTPQNRSLGGVSAAATPMLLVDAARGKIRRSRAAMGAAARTLTTHGASTTTRGAITTSTVGGAATRTNTGTRRMTRALTGAQLSRGRRQACGAWKAATAMRLRCKGPSWQWVRRVVLVSWTFAGLSGPKLVG